MQRRQFLRSSTAVSTATVASTVLTSGCLFGSGPGNGFDLTLNPYTEDPATDFLARDAEQLGPRQTAVIETVRDDGVASMLGEPAFDNGTYVHIDESYVQITVDRDGSGRVSRPVLTAERVEEPPDGEQAVAIERYRSDAEALVERAVRVAHRGDTPEIVLDPATRPSELDPEPEHRYVEYQEETYRLSVDERRVSVVRYRYEWDEVATTREAFAEYLREEGILADADQTDLSTEAREILTEARDSPPSEAKEPFDEAEQEILELLDVERKDTGDVERFVRFDGSYYRARIYWWHSD